MFTMLEDVDQRNTWLKYVKYMNTDITFCLPANDEMRHCGQEGPERHQDTSNCYDLGSVKLGTKITHKGNHQQVS